MRNKFWWWWTWGVKRILQGKRPAIRETKRRVAKMKLRVAMATSEDLEFYVQQLEEFGAGSSAECLDILETIQEAFLETPRLREQIQKDLGGKG